MYVFLPNFVVANSLKCGSRLNLSIVRSWSVNPKSVVQTPFKSMVLLSSST